MLMFFFCAAQMYANLIFMLQTTFSDYVETWENSQMGNFVVCDVRALKSRRENLRKTLSHWTRFQPLAGNPHKKWIWGCFVSETLFKRNGKVLIRKIRVSPASSGEWRRKESIIYSENFHKLSILVPFYIALNATKNFHKRDFQSLLKSRDFCLFIPSRSPDFAAADTPTPHHRLLCLVSLLCNQRKMWLNYAPSLLATPRL